MAKEDPTESSETSTLAEPETPAAPNKTAPTLEWKFLITPIGTLLLGVILALGHHFFNAGENGKFVTSGNIPQRWVTLIGVVFSFAFKSAVGTTMGFVLLQCLWLSVVRQPLTIQEMNIMYRIERQDQLYKTLPRALFFSPTIVVFSAVTLLLPLSGVFAPGSLTVTTQTSTKDGPCSIPTGNLSAQYTPDSDSLFALEVDEWVGITPRAMALTAQCLLEQRIPDLPQACGPNCRYTVSVHSFVLQCTPNPPSLPYGQGNGTGWGGHLEDFTFWNGTTDPTSKLAFYVAWQSGPDVTNGTSGNGSCSSVQAQYDVEVETKGGVQSVTMSIKPMTSPMPDYTNYSLASAASEGANAPFLYSLYQLASISYATQALFLGNITKFRFSEPTTLAENLKPPILDLTVDAQDTFLYFWGDVLKGIEEMSHNITAALLTLSLGTMDATCSFYSQDLVYQYTPFALWVPYGVALGIALISLVVAVMIMARNRTGDITTSFWDTVVLSRNVDRDVSSGAKLRLRAAEDGKLGYTLV